MMEGSGSGSGSVLARVAEGGPGVRPNVPVDDALIDGAAACGVNGGAGGVVGDV